MPSVGCWSLSWQSSRSKALLAASAAGRRCPSPLDPCHTLIASCQVFKCGHSSLLIVPQAGLYADQRPRNNARKMTPFSQQMLLRPDHELTNRSNAVSLDERACATAVDQTCVHLLSGCALVPLVSCLAFTLRFSEPGAPLLLLPASRPILSSRPPVRHD